MKKYNLAAGDFPDIADFQDKLREVDFAKLHSIKQKLIDEAEHVSHAYRNTYIHTLRICT
jgi:hypothetical protein